MSQELPCIISSNARALKGPAAQCGIRTTRCRPMYDIWYLEKFGSRTSPNMITKSSCKQTISLEQGKYYFFNLSIKKPNFQHHERNNNVMFRLLMLLLIDSIPHPLSCCLSETSLLWRVCIVPGSCSRCHWNERLAGRLLPSQSTLSMS